ncbi:LysR family transcriptional regulator [Dongia soli]|uniref:LysR family transcriptional regulator n=1 Tax=Dongia soli TaxID=600628 RepID=A0ABU5EI73_9PROT|nr:LysR family transcriptional regulator [Dongia soli]MDY0885051.1 LysR family transcriptional regulator [Dongia soli]
MDRLDILAIFVAVAEQGSFIAAARRLNRSPAAVTRAVAELEERLGTRLFNRTTRAVALTDAGTRYLDLGRRALADFEELELSAASEKLEPRGLLSVTAPEMFGRLHVLPIVQAFMRDYPQVSVSMLLLNRIVSYIDEGIDLGIRIAALADSTLQAIQVGHIRRVICASPAYLAAHDAPKTPQDLVGHDAIAISGVRPVIDRWTFGKGAKEITVPINARLIVSTIQAALDAAIAGGGVIRVMSYQSEPLEAEGKLQRLLVGYEPPPLPIHVVHPAGRYLAPKVRLFIDRAVEALRGKFETN